MAWGGGVMGERRCLVQKHDGRDWNSISAYGLGRWLITLIHLFNTNAVLWEKSAKCQVISCVLLFLYFPSLHYLSSVVGHVT